MTPIIHSSLAYLLLEVTTRALLLLNNLTNQRGGNNGGIGGNGNGNEKTNSKPTLNDPPAVGTVSIVEENLLLHGRLVSTVVDDSLICGILQRAPAQGCEEDNEVFYTTMGIIEKCLMIAGEESRIALAKFFPYYCLTDESVSVRKVALETIAAYPDLVMKYYNDILLR